MKLFCFKATTFLSFMKKTIKLLLILSLIIVIISIYWTIARYTDLIIDTNIKSNYFFSLKNLFSGILTAFILYIYDKYFFFITKALKPKVSIIIGFLASLLFIILGTLLWSDSWSENPSALSSETREAGDYIWQLGHPLTSLIIDFPVYLRLKYPYLQNFWSDYWAYPSVLILFITQFIIYIQGILLLINWKEIKTYYNNAKSN